MFLFFTLFYLFDPPLAGRTVLRRRQQFALHGNVSENIDERERDFYGYWYVFARIYQTRDDVVQFIQFIVAFNVVEPRQNQFLLSLALWQQ